MVGWFYLILLLILVATGKTGVFVSSAMGLALLCLIHPALFWAVFLGGILGYLYTIGGIKVTGGVVALGIVWCLIAYAPVALLLIGVGCALSAVLGIYKIMIPKKWRKVSPPSSTTQSPPRGTKSNLCQEVTMGEEPVVFVQEDGSWVFQPSPSPPQQGATAAARPCSVRPTSPRKALADAQCVRWEKDLAACLVSCTDKSPEGNYGYILAASSKKEHYSVVFLPGSANRKVDIHADNIHFASFSPEGAENWQRITGSSPQ